MGNIFNPDFKDFIVALNKAQVQYLLVGGYAVILHGYNRTTGDLDVWINPQEDNYLRLMKAFLDFGLPTEAISKEDFLTAKEKDVFTFGRPPVSIDIMTAVKGLTFKETYETSIVNSSEGIDIRLINYNKLIIAKKAANRLRDQSDIKHLKED